jgi:hypothetical protein
MITIPNPTPTHSTATAWHGGAQGRHLGPPPDTYLARLAAEVVTPNPSHNRRGA